MVASIWKGDPWSKSEVYVKYKQIPLGSEHKNNECVMLSYIRCSHMSASIADSACKLYSCAKLCQLIMTGLVKGEHV